ncbi:hypothetical protein MA16_Dca010802 [Dendrobium catenatum]|uniref:Uncharacterized protein n=1 Tax=Dendrobium catenatum TaxID=906689 RepID=A0A2I0W582_9ASPA|nr:hypothetical protein MA16_Dca010802 [Dendrobium catenatum]
MLNILSRIVSDHAPLLLSINANRPTVPYAFLFQNMWLSHKDFSNVISHNWSALIAPNNDIYGMHRLWTKLSRLKQVLRWWNKNVFKNIFSNIKDVEKEVIELEKVYMENPDVENNSSLNEAKTKLGALHDKRKPIGNKKLLLS